MERKFTEQEQNSVKISWTKILTDQIGEKKKKYCIRKVVVFLSFVCSWIRYINWNWNVFYKIAHMQTSEHSVSPELVAIRQQDFLPSLHAFR